ncbi:hypothetical protein THAOC_06863, partial [Thalassiosira oceanica]
MDDLEGADIWGDSNDSGGDDNRDKKDDKP